MLHGTHTPATTSPMLSTGVLGAVDGGAGVGSVPPMFGGPVPADVAGRPGDQAAARFDGRSGPVNAVPAARSEELNRVLNVVIAGIALMVLAPICVLVAILVKLTSPGPVFYTQTRVGLDRRWRADDDAPGGEGDERRLENLGGQPFTILKFRSMRNDAESNGQAVWATKHDARVTPVGRVIRKTRLDEVPQLINVLRGEMNIVGPRPERPSIVVRLREHIPEYTQRHRVKPGITGWAQINHSYDSCLEDVRTKVTYDLAYIERQGMGFDLRIMVSTLPVMLFKRGAH